MTTLSSSFIVITNDNAHCWCIALFVYTTRTRASATSIFLVLLLLLLRNNDGGDDDNVIIIAWLLPIVLLAPSFLFFFFFFFARSTICCRSSCPSVLNSVRPASTLTSLIDVVLVAAHVDDDVDDSICGDDHAAGRKDSSSLVAQRQ